MINLDYIIKEYIKKLNPSFQKFLIIHTEYQ